MATRLRRGAPAVLAVVAVACVLWPTAASAQPVRLHDVGPELGFPRRTHTFDLQVADVDGDGVDDLLVSDHSAPTLYVNHQPGLEPVFQRDLPDPHGCALGDVDGNGLGDVYCVQGADNGSGHKVNRLYLQEAPGEWSDRTRLYGVEDPFGRGRRTTFADLDHTGQLDLVIGNENPRTDDEASVNRTLLGGDAPPMTDVIMGPIRNKGALCLQAYDQNRDGWQDLLVCGGLGRATPGHDPEDNRLHLFRNRHAPDGGRRLVDVTADLGLILHGARHALLARLNGDGFPDLVVVGAEAVTVWPGRSGGGFDPPAYGRHLTAGAWAAVGDVDGRNGPDLFVVQGCNRYGNVRDVLLTDRPGWAYDAVLAPAIQRGCGDTAAMLDVDGDGLEDVVVGNGRWESRGPLQVLTAGPFRGLPPVPEPG